MQNLKTKRQKMGKRAAKALPESSGVYVFWFKNTPLYVGKAKNLKSRVSSYFGKTLEGKTKKMVAKAESFSHIKTSSDFEALLLEAKIVRKLKPYFNIALKDDKHPLYIRITGEKYPRIITARKKDDKLKNLAFFGPFPSSKNVKGVLRSLRKAFPYSDHRLSKRACLRSQIGLCSPCPSFIESQGSKLKETLKKEYLTNIRILKRIISGDINSIKKNLLNDIEKHSKNGDFEMAKRVRDRLFQLEYITKTRTSASLYLENPNLAEDIKAKELKLLSTTISKLKGKRIKIKRIECFDISHTSGKHTAASMVTFINGEAEKSLYRKFKIRQNKGNSDTDSMREVCTRRIKNSKSWGVSDLVVVDGGKGQVTSFLEMEEKLGVPVVGIAKRMETLFVPVKLNGKVVFKQKTLRGHEKNLVQRIRDESHRFARKYHHHLLSKDLLSLKN